MRGHGSGAKCAADISDAAEDRGRPVAQETRTGGWLGPEQAAVFEPAQILVTAAFAQGIHPKFSKGFDHGLN